MKIKITIIFLFLWAVTATSLLAVIFWGGYSFRSHKILESEQASADTTLVSKNDLASTYENELLKLQKENLDLQKMVKSLQDKLLATNSTKSANVCYGSEKESFETLWNKEFSSYYYKPNRHFIESSPIELAIDISAAGDAGIDTLIKAATDEQRVKEERDMAWDILGIVPDKKALDTIMTSLPDEDRSNLFERVWRQVKKLRTSDVEEYIPELNNLIYNKYSSAGSLDYDEIKTLSFLALKHDSSESLNILNDSRVCDGSDTPLIIADYLHTDSTRNFIEEKYSDHPNETYRNYAQEILNYW